MSQNSNDEPSQADFVPSQADFDQSYLRLGRYLLLNHDFSYLPWNDKMGRALEDVMGDYSQILGWACRMSLFKWDPKKDLFKGGQSLCRRARGGPPSKPEGDPYRYAFAPLP